MLKSTLDRNKRPFSPLARACLYDLAGRKAPIGQIEQGFFVQGLKSPRLGTH